MVKKRSRYYDKYRKQIMGTSGMLMGEAVGIGATYGIANLVPASGSATALKAMNTGWSMAGTVPLVNSANMVMGAMNEFGRIGQPRKKRRK